MNVMQNFIRITEVILKTFVILLVQIRFYDSFQIKQSLKIFIRPNLMSKSLL